MEELIAYLSQFIDIPSAGTYRIRFWHRFDYTGNAGDMVYSIQIAGVTIRDGVSWPASGTVESYEADHVLTAGLSKTIQFSTNNSDGAVPDSLDWRIDNVSVKQLLPPLKVTTPDPTNAAPDIPLDQALSWVAGAGGADSYDVYFGKNADPSGDFIGNQPGLAYDPPGDLDGGSTYYWRIDAKNAYGTTTGDVWSFETEAAGRAPDKTVYHNG